jgi:hypothetical protein
VRSGFASVDGYVYVSTKAIAKGAIALLRFLLSGGATTADAIYTSTEGNETGGDIVVSNDCVYWVSSGGVWVVSSAGGNRAPALAAQVTDAVGITADAANIYYTRQSGEVWQRQLSTAVTKRQRRERIAWGFIGIGDVIVRRRRPWTTDAQASFGRAASSPRRSEASTSRIGRRPPRRRSTSISHPNHRLHTSTGGIRRINKVAAGSGDI